MAVVEPSDFQRHMARRKWLGRAFHVLCLVAILIGLSMLGALLYNIISQGWDHIDWQFLTGFPSRLPERASFRFRRNWRTESIEWNTGIPSRARS